MRVSFLIGGTEPAGLNQLYHLLKGHRDIVVPDSPQPEPNFFSKTLEYEKGAEYYHRRYFPHYEGDTCAGEKSGRYLWHPDTPKRIHTYNPAMKLIFILRDPVDRAYSNYRFNCLNGIETLNFANALEAETARMAKMSDDARWRDVQPFAYFDKGLYARQLERYCAVFPAENIYVMNNEALRRDPHNQILAVVRFLGLRAERYQRVDNAPEYPSFHVRSLVLQKTIRGLNRGFLERLLIKGRAGARPTLVERLALLNLSHERTHPHPKVAEAMRLRYEGDLLHLQRLVTFDISGWAGQGSRREPLNVVPNVTEPRVRSAPAGRDADGR